MARFKVGYQNIEGLVPNFTQLKKIKMARFKVGYRNIEGF